MTKNKDNSFFFETKFGTVTKSGDWFHINRKQLDGFAPGLLKHVSFATLIKEAQAWIGSAASISLILIYALLFFINPWIAAVIAILFYAFWYQNKSAFVLNKVASLFKVINSTAFMFIMALICLSYYAINQRFVAFGIGLFFFIVLKPDLPRRLWNHLGEQHSKAKLTLNDRVLKMIIVKQAMYQADSSPDELAEMEDQFASFVAKMKRGNRNKKGD